MYVTYTHVNRFGGLVIAYQPQLREAVVSPTVVTVYLSISCHMGHEVTVGLARSKNNISK